MFGGINFKHLSERINESLHDLESTLSQAAALPAAGATETGSQQGTPTRQQPTRSATSPAGGASAASPSRVRPRPAIDTQARSQSASSSSSTPLSPNSLAQASQSASQLADSALSSLRASLRKGRQSLETAAAARTSLDKSTPVATTLPASTRAATEELPEAKKEPTSEEVEAVREKGAEPSVPSSTSAPESAQKEPEASESGVTKANEPATNHSPVDLIGDAARAGGPAKDAHKEEDLLGPLAPESTPSGKDDEASKPVPAPLTVSDGVSSPDQPPKAVADSAPGPLSTEDDELPVPFVAICPTAPASHIVPASLPSPADYKAADEEEDADDWGMGSISPAPESEGFVDPPKPTQTPAKSNPPEPEAAADTFEPTVQAPEATEPSVEEASEGPAQSEDVRAKTPEDSTESFEPAVVEVEDVQASAPASSIEEAALDSETLPVEDVAMPPLGGGATSSELPATVNESSEGSAQAPEQPAPPRVDRIPTDAPASEAEATSLLAAGSTTEPIEGPAEVTTNEAATPDAGNAVLSAPQAITAAAVGTRSETEEATAPDLSKPAPTVVTEAIESAGEADPEQSSLEEATPSVSAYDPPATVVVDGAREAVNEPPVTSETSEFPASEDATLSERPVEEPVQPVEEPVQPVEDPVQPVDTSDEQAVEGDVETPSSTALDVENSPRGLSLVPDAVPVPASQEESSADEQAEETVDQKVDEKTDEEVVKEADEKMDGKVDLATSQEEGGPEEVPVEVVSGQVNARQVQEADVPNAPPDQPTRASDPESALTDARANGELNHA